MTSWRSDVSDEREKVQTDMSVSHLCQKKHSTEYSDDFQRDPPEENKKAAKMQHDETSHTVRYHLFEIDVSAIS